MVQRRRGHLRCARKSMDPSDPFWCLTPFDAWRARWDLIQRAAFSRYVDEDGVELQRGQLRVSINFLAQRWGWGTKQVRRFVSRLLELETLRLVVRTRQGTVYAVVNYDDYQADPGEQRSLDDGISGHTKRHTKGHSKGHSESTEEIGDIEDEGTAKGTAKGTPKGTKVERRNIEGRKENRGRESSGGSRGKKVYKTVGGKSAPAPLLGDGLPDIPQDLDTPELRCALMGRIEERHKQQKKFHFTTESLAALYRQLRKVVAARGIDHAVFCLEKATSSHYQGVVYKEDLVSDAGGAQGGLFSPRPDAPAASGPRKKF